jgi:hypothetical protein
MVPKFKALLLTCALAISGCVWLAGNRVPVYNVSDAPLSTTRTEAQVGELIRRAARIQGWEIEEVGKNVIYVTKRHGLHSATAVVLYDEAAFSIQLRGSQNFKEGEGRIHKLYNQWVQDLETAIQREVASNF